MLLLQSYCCIASWKLRPRLYNIVAIYFSLSLDSVAQVKYPHYKRSTAIKLTNNILKKFFFRM